MNITIDGKPLHDLGTHWATRPISLRAISPVQSHGITLDGAARLWSVGLLPGMAGKQIEISAAPGEQLAGTLSSPRDLDGLPPADLDFRGPLSFRRDGVFEEGRLMLKLNSNNGILQVEGRSYSVLTIYPRRRPLAPP